MDLNIIAECERDLSYYEDQAVEEENYLLLNLLYFYRFLLDREYGEFGFGGDWWKND